MSLKLVSAAGITAVILGVLIGTGTAPEGLKATCVAWGSSNEY